MKRFANLKSYLGLSLIAALFSGVLVYFGTRILETTIIWALITFIASIVIVATLDLSVKHDDDDPNKPRLS
ncbi:MAG: hypothetical protein RL418_329 [Actinomycetota bacterium]